MQPFSEAEKEGAGGGFLQQWLGGSLDTGISPSTPPAASTLPKRVVAGGYPEACRRAPARARQWQEQYVRSIIQRDIHDISQGDKDQIEVDCVLTQGSQTWGVEVKAAATVRSSDAGGLKRLAAQVGKDFRGGILFYDGSSILPLDRQLKLYAVPIAKLWEI